jgi:hypothetical protein
MNTDNNDVDIDEVQKRKREKENLSKEKSFDEQRKNY